MSGCIGMPLMSYTDTHSMVSIRIDPLHYTLEMNISVKRERKSKELPISN